MVVYAKRISHPRRTVLRMLVLAYFAKEALLLAESGLPYKITLKCEPTQNRKCHATVDSFWEDHADPVAYELNALFRNLGWLKQDASKLVDGGTAALLTKEYRSQTAYEIYMKSWKWFSKGPFKEPQFLAYSSTSAHLF